MNRRLLPREDSVPLLQKYSGPSWRLRVRSCWRSNKVILLILVWQFSTGLTYNLFLQPSAYLHLSDIRTSAMLASGIALIFLVLSPLAGFLADVKFGRFKVLMCSSYLMVVSTSLALLAGGLIAFTVHSFNYYFYIVFALALFSILAYTCGRVFFLANVLQFGTDQLCDAPTRYSVLFLIAYYWCDKLSSVLTLSINIQGYVVPISNVIKLNKLEVILYVAMLIASTLVSTIILLILYKKKHWFMTESIRDNPYRLVYNVVTFALQHKKPIRRSAFTYCENERPSRLDFAKQRYGGPFTTEQVENVKVLFNMLKVLLSLSPAFFLDLSATSTVIHHHSLASHNASSIFITFFLNNGVLSPLLSVFCIPLYLLTVKPLLSKHLPNMFKRMGISIALFEVLFTCYFIWDIFGNGGVESKAYSYFACSENSSHSLLRRSIVPLHHTTLFTLGNILSSFAHVILYIAIWEFICCQSPQCMKGLLFGLFYAMKAFCQFLAATVTIFFLFSWKLQFIDCQSGYHLLNLIIGLITFVIFTSVAYRYKYRKRDDICNVYKYAEDYYSNIK